jgi:phosphate transport system substrate-binding protein
MPQPEIEMYIQRKSFLPGCLRETSVTPIAIVLIALLVASLPAAAASPGVPLFADSDLGAALAQAVDGIGTVENKVDLQPSASVAACASAPGVMPRLALLSHSSSRAERDRCAQTASAEVSIVEIGRQAVALVVPINSPVWALDTGAVFHALGRNSGGAAHPMTWDAIDPSYPKLPIGVLLPSAESRVQRLFGALIMEQGCDRAAAARIPFDRNDRIRFCDAVRDDSAVTRRQGGTQDVANWAVVAPAGQIAAVSLAELRQLDRRVVPLLLDGALPTAANIASGRYPAVDGIDLMIVVPNEANGAQRMAARELAFSLLSEDSIGPAGSLPPAGMIPLPPAERLAARSQVIAFLEKR